MSRTKPIPDDPVRKVLLNLIEEHGMDMASLSKAIGYSHSYIQQYLKRGVPAELPEKARIKIASRLNIPQEWLAPASVRELLRVSDTDWDPAAPPMIDPDAQPTTSTESGTTGIPKDGIAEVDTSAGLGAGGVPMVVQDPSAGAIRWSAEAVRDWWRMPDWFLNRLNARPNQIAAFPAQGDSMEPRVMDGDIVFIDTSHTVPSPPGLYALGDEFGGVILKRLEVISRPGAEDIEVRVISDNSAHSDQTWNIEEIRIIGRFLARVTVF